MTKTNKWVKIGECGVDSGQILIVDPCYVLREKKLPNSGYSYDRLFEELTQKDPMALHREVLFSGIAGTGVVTSSGYGDGGYPVEARYSDDGRVAEVRIRFIDD